MAPARSIAAPIRTVGNGGAARWHNGVSRPNRKIGAIRTRGGEEGLTRLEAERALRKLIESEQPKDVGAEITVSEAGDLLLQHLEVKGLKPTTLSTYDSALRTHLRRPPLGDLQLHNVSSDQVEALLTRMRRDGKAPKTIANAFKLSSTRSSSSARGSGGAARTRASSSTRRS